MTSPWFDATSEDREAASVHLRNLMSQRRDAFHTYRVGIEKASEPLLRIVEYGIQQIKRDHPYNHIHIRSCQDIEPPEDLDTWIERIEDDDSAMLIRTKWKVESIYSVIEPIERACNGISRLCTKLRQWENIDAPTKKLNWSISQDMQVMEKAFEEQKDEANRLIQEQIEIVTSILQPLADEMESETAILGEALLQFRNADEHGKIDIFKEIWTEATDQDSWRTFEKGWKNRAMRRARALMRSHMTTAIPIVVTDMTKNLESFKIGFGKH